jgi:cell wall-associated NlpC family hydrolase
VTQEGIDCSGFTQFLFKTYGVVLPRDAEEQAIVGQIVGFGRDVVRVAQPGDLIFFMNEHGKVNHVAVSLGGDRILHSSSRNVHFASLLDQPEANEERLLDRVLWARRVLY